MPCVYFFAPAAEVTGLGVAGLLGTDDLGREKFTEAFPWLSACSATFDNLLFCRDVAGGGILALSTLEPLPPLPRGVGDMTRCGGSKLLDLLCPVGICVGSAGTGGASGAGLTTPLTLPFPPGDGDLNVRSVIDPPLPLRCRLPQSLHVEVICCSTRDGGVGSPGEEAVSGFLPRSLKSRSISDRPVEASRWCHKYRRRS